MDIIPATAADADELGALIAEAFADLPPSRWLVGDPADWRAVADPYFAMFVEHALAGAGAVDTTVDRAAVAVWFDNASQEPRPPDDYDARLARICGRYTPRFLAFDEELEKAHPGAPHHHLAFLAVRPARQRAGLGSALLRRHQEHLDEHGIAGYLEAASRSLPSFYARHGYQPLDTLVAPEGTPLMYPMWREPAPAWTS